MRLIDKKQNAMNISILSLNLWLLKPNKKKVGTPSPPVPEIRQKSLEEESDLVEPPQARLPGSVYRGVSIERAREILEPMGPWFW